MQEASSRSPWAALVGRDGFPCGNFAVAANVSRRGQPLGLLLRNPGRLGHCLESVPGGRFIVGVNGVEVADEDMRAVHVGRQWPFAAIVASDPGLGPVTVSTRVWAPVGLDDEETSSLPLIQIEMTLRNEHPTPCRSRVRWVCSGILDGAVGVLDAHGLNGAQAGDRLVACDHPVTWDDDTGELVAQFPLAGHGEQRLRFMVVLYDPEGAAARRFADCAEIARHAMHNWENLAERTRRLEAALPVTGKGGVDDALRWYLGSSVYMTKCTRDGAVLTMGYCELNQRDGYWASWPHLVLWPSVERRMIEESCAALGFTGKVPTCILPRIDRADDLDINAYFVLRALRYATHRQDTEFLERLWPSLRRASDWLLDGSREGLPVQRSYWGDWKDVPGVAGRKYSPHACLVYLAMLSRMRSAASELGDASAEARYAQAYARGLHLLNLPVTEGGLWNGACYVQVWHDHRLDDKALLDQCVGIVFGVVDPERARLILEKLEANLGPHGSRETWPYHPDSFGYPAGVYHNGGVWPWLCFVEAWARWLVGQREAALCRIETVAHADLEREGDWMPHEYVHGETGENRGPPIQAWNACLFGAVRFGILGNGRVP